ncbi:hypothetical protein BE18_19915, partial [Sorangium cellulosum]
MDLRAELQVTQPPRAVGAADRALDRGERLRLTAHRVEHLREPRGRLVRPRHLRLALLQHRDRLVAAREREVRHGPP